MALRVEARNLPANIEVVLDKLRWMRQQRIWPNGLRYLWTDAFGLVLLVSLHRHLGDRSYLDEAEWLVGEVDRVLGRARGIRIGEAPDRDGQYFHYLAKWLFALGRLGRLKGEYRNRAIGLEHDGFDERSNGLHSAHATLLAFQGEAEAADLLAIDVGHPGVQQLRHLRCVEAGLQFGLPRF